MNHPVKRAPCPPAPSTTSRSPPGGRTSTGRRSSGAARRPRPTDHAPEIWRGVEKYEKRSSKSEKCSFAIVNILLIYEHWSEKKLPSSIMWVAVAPPHPHVFETKPKCGAFPLHWKHFVMVINREILAHWTTLLPINEGSEPKSSNETKLFYANSLLPPLSWGEKMSMYQSILRNSPVMNSLAPWYSMLVFI